MEPPLPKGHRHLTFPDMARLTLNEHGNLCLDGKPIEVKRVTLTKAQAAVALITSCVIIAQGVVYILQAFKIL